MAIGDTTNPNLFGTDYNAGEEERKRFEAEASLAAQNARIGSPNLLQGATTFQDISGGQGGALNAEQGARDLRIGRQYESGGAVTLEDMGSLMQAPQNARIGSGMDMTQENPDFGAMLSSSGIPGSKVSSLVPGIENIKNPGAFDPTNVEPDGPIISAGTAGRDERTTLSEYVSQGISSAVEGLRDAVGTESISMDEYKAAKAAQGTPNADQALPDGAGSFQPGGVDFSKPSTIKPPTMPEAPKLGPELKIRQGEEGSPQGYFNAIIDERPLTPDEIKSGKAFADRKGFDFNPQTGFSVIDNPGARAFDTPATRENFQARGLDVGQFMRYEDDPSQRTEQFVDEQGRLRRRLTRDAAALQEFSPERIAQDRPLAPEFAQAEATGDKMIADLRAKEAAEAKGREGKMSYTDAKRRARGEFAAKNIDPSPSQLRKLAKGIQAAEPERLAGLANQRAINESRIREAKAKQDFKPQVVDIGGQRLIQLSPNYYQPVRPEPKPGEPFEPRVLEEGGFTYYETAPNRFERQPSTKTGGATGAVSSMIDETIAAGGEGIAIAPAPTADTPGVATGDEFTPQQEAGIQRVMADNNITREGAIKALKESGQLK